MTDLQAALGISQLKKLEKFIRARSALASEYSSGLSELPLTLPCRPSESSSSWHLYVIRLTGAKPSATRQVLFEGLRRRGIGVNCHYIPVHTQPYYKSLGFNEADFPVAVDVYNRSLSLPLFPNLLADEQNHIIQTLRELL